MQFLSLFGIEAEHLRDKRYLAFLVFVLALMCFICVKNMENTGGDFVVFWWAGKNFIDGNDLYSNIGGAERYIYPPFAAMWFQLFALNSIFVAGAFWKFCNFGLFAIGAVLIRKIYLHFFDDVKTINFALLLSALFSFRYFWYHQLYLQMNEVMFVLCLAGILSHLQGKETAAAAFFTVGMFVKVLPIFFLVWLVSKGNWKTVLKILAVSVVCAGLPMLFRGFEQGCTDHLRYYITFLEPFQRGHVEPEFRNYGLTSMIYNWTQPTMNEPMGFSYQWLYFTLDQTKLLLKTLSLLLVIGLFAMLFFARFIYKKNSYWEPVYIFACMNLLSGICWEYHIVPIFFMLMPFFIYAKQGIISPIKRGVTYFLLFAAFLLDIIGTDTVGVKNFHYIGGYGFLTLLLLGLAMYSLQSFFAKKDYI